ncbi:isotrichodermin C-15 hydroxylase [Podospora australis]|uniref:Isotrichodermin C-15 hydroxylase n=1 Tax=Podospora australis TaxID=1536484 RepID=A0AAN6X8F4_9PEZI|nr:isotrichodermin C-15 hydroxylase [Podospora australis]
MIDLGAYLGEASFKGLVLLGCIIITLFVWQLSTIAWHVFFHPLRHFPGPLLQRASRLPYAIQQARGLSGFRTQQLHEKYGPVVRITPNHLSFTDPRAWRDIYSNSPRGKSEWPEMPKCRVFFARVDDQPDSILSTEYPEHQNIRRALSQGFSEASLSMQESMIMKHVNLLMHQLHKRCDSNHRETLDMTAWYNWATFDITGDLVFGQSFQCLEKCEYHPFILEILKGLKAISIFISLIYLGHRWLVRLIFRVVGNQGIALLRKTVDDLVLGRLSMEAGRSDVLEDILKHRQEWGFSFSQISANAFIITIAGSETSATALAGTTYLLLSNPRTLKTLTEEILRVVPPEGREIAGHFVPGGTFVEVQSWSINHSPDNWTEPWAFRPERFLVGGEEAKKGGDILEASQPFSQGPRNCIGRSLSMAEMRLILSRIILDFDMRLGEDVGDWILQQRSYPLWDKGPLNVLLTPVRS